MHIILVILGGFVFYLYLVAFVLLVWFVLLFGCYVWFTLVLGFGLARVLGLV